MDLDLIRDLMARWSCNRAHLALFTQFHYRDALCAKNRENAYVAPAVWVNEGDILDLAAAEAAWASKLNEPVRLLFAGRLSLAKGIGVLLAALRSLDAQGIEVRIDMVGQGDQRGICLRAAAELHSVRLSILEPSPYGEPFFKLLRHYHALVVPSLTHEQPRVVFDANAQAVPVIASDTDGLRPHVEHGKTAGLFQR